jgi:hypothetical protein
MNKLSKTILSKRKAKHFPITTKISAKTSFPELICGKNLQKL